eukprot:CAMPEP_0180479114 /NCGR_PEP_ID=MMETSP1036_2-20121128/33129_1 /TAXON_ID=632150 /ORGANISM="Azadinium spinosum, Strain 3D9" /LENGTH=65 /DNA_ID=CAMNT_0022486659 /DNA_START=137 /DNA_END=331 /DNA_ORIENTATION=-
MLPGGRVDTRDPEGPHVVGHLLSHVILMVELLHDSQDRQPETSPGSAIHALGHREDYLPRDAAAA